MESDRKYLVVILLAACLTVVLVGNLIREPFRMRTAQAADRQEYVLKGAALYAESCVQCHGPKGEGVIGMPLNRKALQTDDTSSSGRELYETLYDTIWRGRTGLDEHPRWVQMPNGRWLSYTSMAAFGTALGGGLNEDQVRALTLFIMNPDGTQWSLPGTPDLAPFEAATYPVDESGLLKLPDPPGVDPVIRKQAQSVLRDRTRSQCLNCHTVGATGARIGPDLSDLGRWGVDRAFIAQWIRYANQPMHHDADQTVLPHDRRMAVYWSSNRAVTGPDPDLTGPVVSEGPYYMLRFKDRLTDAEIEALADYLTALRLK